MGDSVCYINARAPAGAKNGMGLGRPCLSLGKNASVCFEKRAFLKENTEKLLHRIFLWPGLGWASLGLGQRYISSAV